MPCAIKVSGFTIIRNAVRMGYPIVESIQSLLPMVDEMVVGVGQSDGQADDGTRELIESINDPKLKIFDSFWDTQKTKGGLILSEKTNEALARCSNDWCFYLQGDEVVHENDHSSILASLEKHAADPRTQGLLFDYVHFYGSYDVIATSRNWYRKEVRIVRKSSGIQSYNDAQGFRVHGEKPIVNAANGRIFHYGWVKAPKQMGEKNRLLSRWWHGDKLEKEFDNFQFDNSYGLRKFQGTHPSVMQTRVQKQDWKFQPMRTWTDWTLKDLNLLASDLFESVFHHRIGEYKNYRLLK